MNKKDPSSKNSFEKDADFAPGDFVVYPTHGVGLVTGVEDVSISGQSLSLFVIEFEQDRMTLRGPVR